MGVYKRGGTWWFKFNWNGRTVRESTKQSNKRVADQMEAARKTALAKGEVGIEERAVAPTLGEFQARFMQAIEVRCANKPRTIAFYREKFQRVLEHRPLANARLDVIDEAMIEAFIQERRKRVGIVTVNRQLATLRRALRLAHEWKILNRVPRIRLLPGERVREFVLTSEQERLYLATTTQPLHDVALLMLDTGLRLGEALALEWKDISLTPGAGAKYGYLQVRSGKTANAKRAVSLTCRAIAMLNARRPEQDEGLVFRTVNGGPYLGTYMNRLHQNVRQALKLPPDFVLHSMRHSMLTRLGEAGVDAFTIMRIAGHSSITISQRYVHPSSEAMERAIEKLEIRNGAKRGVGTDLGTPSISPQPATDPKLLI